MYYAVVTRRKCIAKHTINHRISADWSTTNPIAAFSCTPSVHEVHTKAEIVQLTTALLGLGVLCNSHAEEMYRISGNFRPPEIFGLEHQYEN